MSAPLGGPEQVGAAAAAGAPWREALRALLGGAVEFDVPLAPRVAFRIGGPADALARPRTTPELAGALALARAHGVPVTILGSGSNVLVSDLGIRGLTLRFAGELAAVRLLDLDDAGLGLDAAAGALNATLVAQALRAGGVGLEFLATIPGTFGGALVMNAGAHGGEVEAFVTEVRLLDLAGREQVRPRAACGFAYRQSGFAAGEVLLGARLRVPRGDAGAAKAHLAEMRSARRRTQPGDHPNAGSIFKNPPGDHAGRLIEAAGLKGRRVGGAVVSQKHANFIVNTGGARASEVVALARIVQGSVQEYFGVRLDWEVKRLGEPAGFESDPTLATR